MIQTTFLIDEQDGSKKFNSLNVYNITKSAFNYTNRKIQYNNILSKTRGCQDFSFNKGETFLKKSNEIYYIDYTDINADLVLPRSPSALDWILLIYEPHILGRDLTIDDIGKIKIYGNGSRIMGLDEPLICDMKFMSLRLTFINPTDGWIIT